MDMQQEVSIIHDLEANGLLDDTTVDYTTSPWTIKDSFKLHVISVLEEETNQLIAFYDGDKIELDGREHSEIVDGQTYSLKDYAPLEYLKFPLAKFKDYVLKRKIKKATAHNGIGYDLLVYKARLGVDYTITTKGDTWGGKVVEHHDTLVFSKVLNPDRRGGHSLENLAKLARQDQKISFRPHVPKDKKFEHFSADMLYYNLFDLKATKAVQTLLATEAGEHPWQDAYVLEKCIAHLITKQTHRGFHFNLEQAQSNIRELDKLLQEAREKVEPILPAKKATKAVMCDFTPPVKQFNKDGSLSKHMQNFVEKVQGEVQDGVFIFKGKSYPLPLEVVPLVTEVPASIDDSTHIKEWLVSLGWDPSEWKEKDLTVGAGKEKLNEERYEATVQRYIKQTLASSFKEGRLDFLGCSGKDLYSVLTGRKAQRSMRVRTNPSLTRGQDKEICPNLLLLQEKFPFAKDVVSYYTYKHRRNSILGGGVDWEADEEDMEKGYMAALRKDGRIPTPADPCGAATSRMKHRVTCNIPRVTSLYGEQMRKLFRADPLNCYQIGYDFASLEARIEAHYCHNFEATEKDGSKPYCASLLLEKPNDVHSVTARKISEIIAKPFERGPAKSVKYACTYGAQASKVAKTVGADLSTGQTIYNAFWEAALPLKLLKEALTDKWERDGKKYILTIDKRKVPTRAAHAILNSLFQSAGVICAKRSMVIWEESMQAEGLTVDFWTEDWKNKSFGQQMIAYHDESQIEVTKDLVKFKMFSTKEDCNAFRDLQYQQEGKVWSEAHESAKGKWFVAYSRVGELVVQAVKEATAYYKLNVPLSADYVLGRDWAECH